MASEELESTALRLFGLRGVDGVSIADIAEAAGMSKANVMHHYGNKDQLYRACLEQVGHRLEVAARAVSDDPNPTASAAIARELDRWAAAHPDDVYLLAFGLLRLRDRPGRWVLDDAIASLMAAFQASPEEASDLVIEHLGRVTYAAMTSPLRGRLDAAARNNPHRSPT